MGIDVDELITRFEEIESLFSGEDAEIVEREGLSDNKELPAHRKASILKICKMTKRELLKIKDRLQQKSESDQVETEEPKFWKKGKYMGTAGEAPDYE